jgi:predicted AAA+ superfamily ATPase
MRYLTDPILKDLDRRMVILSGPRQCGKTTFSKWILKEKLSGEYLNWDQIKDRKRIQTQNWNEDSQLVVFDEIHKKKNWKTFLKGIFDTKPSSMRMLITGSARLEFFQKSGDSMFGRFQSWRMHPFCMAEDPLNLDLQARWERLLHQGNFPFPYLASDEDEVNRWRRQRWTLLLREDVRDLEQVKDLQALELLAEILKNYAGGLISFSNLAEDVEISPKTVKKWVQILEKLYLVYLLTPYSGSMKRTLSKSPKVYFIDSADLQSQSIGARVENLVMLNLLKRIQFLEDSHGAPLSLHFIRDKEGREVDFLIASQRKPIALIEVKNSFQDPDPSLLYFKSRLNVPFAIQLHTDIKQKQIARMGVKILSAQEFFSKPLAAKNFWE